MKVILINKFFYQKGGSETYFFGIRQILENNGNQLIEFSMKDKKNFPSRYTDFFVNEVDYKDNRISTKIKNGLKIIYSKEAYDKLIRLIDETKPDIAHVNLMCHQLTPSVFYALKKRNIPIVYSSHDFKIICPNYKMYNKNGVCKKCKEGSFYNCLVNKCHKDSRANSLIVTIESYLHRFLKSYEIPDKIICPSDFMLRLYSEAGISKNRLVHMPNFITEEFYDLRKNYKKKKRENTLLYFGRLVEEKGVEILLEAKKQLPEIKLRIVGTGPEEQRLKNLAQEEKLENIEFAGFKSGDELYKEISQCKCTVIPSGCYEIFGLTIVESYCFGTPVIGSRAGGIPELIREGQTGYLFDLSDIDDLIDKIKKMFSLPEEEYDTMCKNCLKETEKYSPQKSYEELIGLYRQLV